jgi:hypothetical protein
MILPVQLLAAYAVTKPKFEALQKRVDPILSWIAENEEGLYFSRLKTPSSIFEKLLLGKYSQPLIEMNDLLATTIVLPNAPLGKARDAFQELLENDFLIEDTKSFRQ